MRKILATAVVLTAMTAWFGCEQQADMYQQANMKTRWMEAQTNLQAMALSETTFKGTNFRYAISFKEMDFSFMSNNLTYSYFLGDDVIKGVLGPDKLPDGLRNFEPTADAYVIYAVANLDSDDDLDVWQTDQNRNVKHVKSDLDQYAP